MNQADAAISVSNWEELQRYMPEFYARLLPCKGKAEAAAVLCAYEIGYNDGRNYPMRWIERYTLEYKGRVYQLRELLELADRLHHTCQPIGKDLQYSHSENQ